jgi:hypothetical protein
VTPLRLPRHWLISVYCYLNNFHKIKKKPSLLPRKYLPHDERVLKVQKMLLGCWRYFREALWQRLKQFSAGFHPWQSRSNFGRRGKISRGFAKTWAVSKNFVQFFRWWTPRLSILSKTLSRNRGSVSQLVAPLTQKIVPAICQKQLNKCSNYLYKFHYLSIFCSSEY